MTLLITIIAAIIATLMWYSSPKAREMKVGTLALMFWGASLMWSVDAVFEYIELREEFFYAAYSDVINDTLLGLAVVVLGLIIYTVILLVKDPCYVTFNILKKKYEK